MSKSSGNNSNDINMVFIERLINAIGDLTIRLDEINRTLFSGDFIDRAFNKHFSKYNKSQMSATDFERAAKNFVKDIENFLKVNYNLGTTKKEHAAIDAFVRGLSDSFSGSQISDKIADRMLIQFKNFFSSAVFESMKGAQRGQKNANLYFTNTLDNEKLTESYKEFARRIGVSLDETSLKLMAFFQEQEKQKEKKAKNFVNDLIEGLEKSKWVGGALRDTFRLIGLLGANWMSQFGQLGRILGGAFYVAMETAGPLLVNLLLKGMGKLFISLPRMLGGLWGGAVKLSTNLGGPLSMFAPGRWGMMSGAGKAASAGRLAAAGLASAGLGAGAIWAGGQSVQSFKQGDKVGGGAFGIGAAGLGVAAIAAIVAGVAAPVTLIAAAVGGIAVTVGAIWKNREAILEHYKKHKEFYDKLMTIMELIVPPLFVLRKSIEWIMEHWPFGKKDKDGNENGPVQWVKNILGIQDTKAVQNISGVGINKAGGVIGVEKLDKMTASRVAEEYFKQYPEQAKNVYERVGSKYASLGDFRTDWAIRNTKGQATEAILYAGASQNLEKMWDALVSSGAMTKERAELMKYTSGRKGAGGPHASKSKHANIMNMVTDLGAASWTDEEWKAATEVLSPMLSSMGFKLKYEGVDKSGKTHFTDNFVAGLSNRHFHVELAPGYENMAPEGAKANIENYKTSRKDHSIEVQRLAQFVDPVGVEQEQLKKLKDGVVMGEREYESFLKERKVWKDQNTGSWMRETPTETQALWRNDATGNLEWRSLISTMQGMSNGSTNGR